MHIAPDLTQGQIAHTVLSEAHTADHPYESCSKWLSGHNDVHTLLTIDVLGSSRKEAMIHSCDQDVLRQLLRHLITGQSVIVLHRRPALTWRICNYSVEEVAASPGIFCQIECAQINYSLGYAVLSSGAHYSGCIIYTRVYVSVGL